MPGHADIILAPSIEVANTFSKTLNYLMHSSNAGIVMGAAAPIILPSRASDPASKYASLAMGVLLAKKKIPQRPSHRRRAPPGHRPGVQLSQKGFALLGQKACSLPRA